MRMSPAGTEWLAAWEGGVQARVYLDSAGYRTIGVGHLIMDGEEYEDGVEYDRADLLRLFHDDDLAEAEEAVSRLVSRVLLPHQFDALVSFTFNCGATAFRRSTLLRRIESGDFDDVPRQLARWNKAGGRVVRGLVRRRDAEGVAFSRGEYIYP